MKKQLVFILSSGRSGSTVLSKFLGMNSQAFALSEPKYFDKVITSNTMPDNLCSCENKLNDCLFWQSVITELKKKNIDVNSFHTSKFNFINSRKWFSKIFKYITLFIYYATGIIIYRDNYFKQIQNQAQLFKIIDSISDKSVYIDASKDYVRALFLSRLLREEFDFKFIILFREPLANVFSKMKKQAEVSIGSNIISFKKQENQSIEAAVLEWKSVSRNFIFLNKIFRTRASKIIYEDFADNPKRVFQKMVNEINLKWEDSMLNLNQSGHHMISGNLSRINAKNIRKPSIEFNNLSLKERNYIEKKTKSVSRLIGFKI